MHRPNSNNLTSRQAIQLDRGQKRSHGDRNIIRTLLVPLTTAAAAFSLGSDAIAQSSEFRLGGEVIDVWITPNPNPVGGGSDEAIVFTAESGPRIRRIDTATGTSTFDFIAPNNLTSQTLHGIYVTPTRSFGIAVGSNGTALWAGAGSNTWLPFVNPPTTSGAHLWKGYWDTTNGHYGMVAGESDSFAYTTSVTGAWTPVTLPAVPGYRRDFYSLAFSDVSTPGAPHAGIAGYRLDDSNSSTQDEFGFFTTQDGITWTRHAVATPPLITQLSTSNPTNTNAYFIWDIDFKPGSATEATAVGGLALGNGPGFAGHTTDGGVTWTWTYPVCHGVNLPLGLCTAASTWSSPPTPCAGDVHPVGTEQLAQFATLYGVAVQHDGTAVATSYGAGVWRYDPATQAWLEIKDTSQFATGPMWGCDALQVGTKDHLFATGLFGDIRRSSDLGQTYTQWTYASGHTAASSIPDRAWRLQDVALATSGVAWAVGQLALVAYSIDDGDTWTPRTFSRAQGTPTLKDVAASDQDHAVAISLAQVLYTTNMNNCWNSPTTNPTLSGSVMNDVVWQKNSNSNLRFWITGSNASLWVTDDSGDTWNPVVLDPSIVPSTFDARSIAFGAPGLAVVVGDVGGQAEAYLLSNVPNSGNASPTVVDACNAAVPHRLNAVAIAGSQAYAVGDAGTILIYSAGSFAPVSPPSPTSEDLYQVCTVNAGGGHYFFASGNRGTLLERLPGQSWAQIQSWTTDGLTGLTFRSPTLGLATGLNSDGVPGGPHTPTGWGDSELIKIK